MYKDGLRPGRTLGRRMVYGLCFLFATLATYAALPLVFNDKVTVDSAFVTGAAAPTDIAFTADGRAIITQNGGPLLG